MTTVPPGTARKLSAASLNQETSTGLLTEALSALPEVHPLYKRLHDALIMSRAVTGIVQDLKKETAGSIPPTARKPRKEGSR